MHVQRSLFDAPLAPRPATNPVALPQTVWRSKSRFEPRDYQTKAIEQTFDLFGKGSPGVLVVQPTGSGKTVTGTLIAERWISQGPEYRVMICAHERQLVTQFAEEIESILGIRPAIEMADQRVHTGGFVPRVIVSSRQTLMEDRAGKSRLYKFPHTRYNWLLITDEAHRWKRGLKSCRHILDWFAENPESRRLGLTATPERGDRVSIGGIFPDVALDYRLYDIWGGPSAVNDGWAVPYRQHFVTPHGVEWKNVRDVAGDFKDEDLEALLAEREVLLTFVKPTVDLVGDRRTILFSPTAAMARRVAEVLNEYRPTSARSLDGTAANEHRQRIYTDHQTGKFQFLSVCGLCREGYNDPGIAAVAVFRPTKSRSLAEQMKGRGCRPLRGLVDGLPDAAARRAVIAASPKPDCLIIDLVGITGMPPVVSTADILANGLPDEVVERANKNAAGKDGADMQDELRQAKAEIEAEQAAAAERQRKRQEKNDFRREQRRKQREDADRLEAERRAQLRGDVNYQHTEVEQGSGGSYSRHHEAEEYIWKWGKFAGQSVRTIPEPFLRWAAKQAKGKTQKHAVAELQRREYERATQRTRPTPPAGVTPGQQRLLARHGLQASTFAEAAELIMRATSPVNQPEECPF